MPIGIPGEKPEPAQEGVNLSKMTADDFRGIAELTGGMPQGTAVIQTADGHVFITESPIITNDEAGKGSAVTPLE